MYSVGPAGACASAQRGEAHLGAGEHLGRLPALEGPGHRQTPVSTSCVAAGGAFRGLSGATATFPSTVLRARSPCIEASPQRFPEKRARASPYLLSLPRVASMGRGEQGSPALRSGEISTPVSAAQIPVLFHCPHCPVGAFGRDRSLLLWENGDKGALFLLAHSAPRVAVGT